MLSPHEPVFRLGGGRFDWGYSFVESCQAGEESRLYPNRFVFHLGVRMLGSSCVKETV